jgi:hypothetical protein
LRRSNNAGDSENADNEWASESRQLDRQWYADEDGAHDDDANPFAGMDKFAAVKEEQIRQEKTQKRISAQRRQLNEDQVCWCMNIYMQCRLSMSIGLGVSRRL